MHKAIPVVHISRAPGSELALLEAAKRRAWQVRNLYEHLCELSDLTKDLAGVKAIVEDSGVLDYAIRLAPTYERKAYENLFHPTWLQPKSGLEGVLRGMLERKVGEKVGRNHGVAVSDNNCGGGDASLTKGTKDQHAFSADGTSRDSSARPQEHPDGKIDTSLDVFDERDASSVSDGGAENKNVKAKRSPSEVAELMAALDLQGKGDGPNGTDVDMDRWFEWWYERHCSKRKQKDQPKAQRKVSFLD